MLTASAGTLLEAQNRKADTAVMLVLVFGQGKVTQEKLAANHRDVENFLAAVNAYDEAGFKVIPNNTDIKLYFKEILL